MRLTLRYANARWWFSLLLNKATGQLQDRDETETRFFVSFRGHFEADTKVQSDYVQTLPSVLMPNASSAGLRLSFVLPVFRSQLQVTSEHRDICELSLLSSSFKQENFPILNFYQLYGMVTNTRLVVALNF